MIKFDINFIFKSTSRTLVPVKELSKATFCHQKNPKKAEQTSFAWKLFQPPIQVCRGAYISCFKITALFSAALIFQRIHQPSGWPRSTKWETNILWITTPSPSELTSKIHPHIFWIPKGFISPEYFLIFFSNLYITPWLQKTGPSTKRGWGRGREPCPPPSHFQNSTLPEMFSWKLILDHSPRHFPVWDLEKFQIYDVKLTGRYICE